MADPTPTTAVTGIFQGDIIIRSAVVRCITELRQNPDLIQDALASLPQDDLTAGVYGNVTIDQCTKWFLGTDVKCKIGLKVTGIEAPAIVAVELSGGAEAEATLGDKHYQTSEQHPRKPGTYRTLCSVEQDETYTIALFATGEPEYVLFLYTLVLFQLLRRKKDLLDARGFQLAKFQSGVAGLVDPNIRENLYMRSVNLTGKVRHVWPDVEDSTGLVQEVDVSNTAATASGASAFDDPDWQDLDMLTGTRLSNS